MAENKIPIYKLTELGKELSGVHVHRFPYEDHLKFTDSISVPHRHDHYCCFLVEEGSFDFNVDFQLLHLKKRTLLISYPGQVHQFVSNTSKKKCKCIGLIFDAKRVDEKARMIIEEAVTGAALLALDKQTYEWYHYIIDLIESAIQEDAPSQFQQKLVRSLLDAFLYKSTLLYQKQESTRIREYSSRNIDITKRFRQLLKENFKTLKKPSDYAERMNISVSYLNDTVKWVTGFPLSYFIQQEVMSEAQRLLFYSELSIKEIAYSLGYDDEKYFIRLFGKTMGSSPACFRKARSVKRS